MSEAYNRMERLWDKYMDVISKCDRLMNEAHNEWETAKNEYEKTRQ